MPVPDIPDLVEYWLDQWAIWSQRDNPRLGYPSRSLGLVTGGESRRFDDWAEDQEKATHGQNCLAVDVVVRGLPDLQKQWICGIWLGQNFASIPEWEQEAAFCALNIQFQSRNIY